MSDMKNEENVPNGMDLGDIKNQGDTSVVINSDNIKTEDEAPKAMDSENIKKEDASSKVMNRDDITKEDDESKVIDNDGIKTEDHTSKVIDSNDFKTEEDAGQEMEIVDIKKEENASQSMSADVEMAEDQFSLEVQYPKNAQELGEVCTKFNREGNYFLSSKIPDICKQQPCILGIDEAGRGPVLGPMVYGICYCPKMKEDDLKETGCADSKSLTEEKRETIFEQICEHGEYIGWEVEVISPSVISTSMLRRQKVSLNEISHNAAIGLVKRALEAGVMLTEIFVDTVGPAEKYQAKLKGIFPELSVTVAKKADSTYPIVGGASICAKVTRDVVLKSWTFSEIDSSDGWGSGYPNDPVTQKFLLSTMDPIFGFPQLVRFSWSTAEKILLDKAVRVDWEDTEDGKGAPSVKSFFSAEDKKLPRYFKDRCLKNVDSL